MTLLPLFAILVLLVVPLALLVLRLSRPGFGYHWLVTVFGALAALILILLARPNSPQTIAIVQWPAELFLVSPTLLVDSFSWPYALSLVTLALAVPLTDLARAREAGWLSWASGLAITAAGLLAVLAGNPLTLLLAWAAIDLIELLALLGQVQQGLIRERVVLSFAARVAGILLVIAAGIAAVGLHRSLSFSEIPAEVSIFLLLAAGFRLGVLPLNVPLQGELLSQRSLGVQLRLIPAAASLILLTRTATAGVPQSVVAPLLLLVSLAAVYAGLSWAVADNALAGRPFWMLGVASLAVAAAIRGQPAASLAWGLAALFSGALISLATARHKRLLPLLLLGAVTASSLPFMPSWPGVMLYTSPISAPVLLLLLPQALLLAGFARHALARGDALPSAERWVWLIYPLGLLLLLVAHFIAAWGGFTPADFLKTSPSILQSWPALATILFVGLLLFLDMRGFEISEHLIRVFRNLFSLVWLYRGFWATYRAATRLVSFLSLVLEGEGGVLWALLLLALLLSVFIQRGMGG